MQSARQACKYGRGQADVVIQAVRLPRTECDGMAAPAAAPTQCVAHLRVLL